VCGCSCLYKLWCSKVKQYCLGKDGAKFLSNYPAYRTSMLG
jgi:hypothetical protein